MFVRAGQNGPLYFLTLRPWFSLMGTSEFALRYPSAMAGVLCCSATVAGGAPPTATAPHAGAS